MDFKETSKLILKLGTIVAGTTLGAAGTYFAALGASDGISTFIGGRKDPHAYPNYAQRQENNGWCVGLGGLAIMGGAYLALNGLKKLRNYDSQAQDVIEIDADAVWKQARIYSQQRREIESQNLD